MTGPEGRAGLEAARLVAAAQEWLRTSAPHLAPVGEDGEPCSCPLCRAVVSVREADPDVIARWVDTAVSGVSGALAYAAAAASDRDPDDRAPDDRAPDDHAPDDREQHDREPEDDEAAPDPPAEPGVRRIPLDDAGEAPTWP